MNEKLVKLREPIPLSRGEENGRTYQFVAKKDIIDRLIDVLGPIGEGWDFKVTAREVYGDSAIVRGILVVMPDKAVLLPSPELSGGHAVNEKVTTADAFMKAENALLKRCASFFGIPVTDESEKIVSETSPIVSISAGTPGAALQTAVIAKAELVKPTIDPPTPEVATQETPEVVVETVEAEVTENITVEANAPDTDNGLPQGPPPPPFEPTDPSGGEVVDTEVKAPTYESLFPHIGEIMAMNYEVVIQNDKLKDYLEKYGANKGWYGQGKERISRKRLLECLEYCKSIISKGPDAVASIPPPVPIPTPVVEEAPVVPHPAAQAPPAPELFPAPAAATPPFVPEVPVLGTIANVLDIGPAPRNDFSIMGQMLEVIEVKAAAKGMSPTDFMRSLGWPSTEIDTACGVVTQEQFNQVYI